MVSKKTTSTAAAAVTIDDTSKEQSPQNKSGGQPTVNRLFVKTRLCRFNGMGICTRGSACKFAHTRDERRPLPDLSRTKLCGAGAACENPHCRFAHTGRELRKLDMRRPASPKRQASKTWDTASVGSTDTGSHSDASFTEYDSQPQMPSKEDPRSPAPPPVPAANTEQLATQQQALQHILSGDDTGTSPSMRLQDLIRLQLDLATAERAATLPKSSSPTSIVSDAFQQQCINYHSHALAGIDNPRRATHRFNEFARDLDDRMHPQSYVPTLTNHREDLVGLISQLAEHKGYVRGSMGTFSNQKIASTMP